MVGDDDRWPLGGNLVGAVDVEACVRKQQRMGEAECQTLKLDVDDRESWQRRADAWSREIDRRPPSGCGDQHQARVWVHDEGVTHR